MICRASSNFDIMIGLDNIAPLTSVCPLEILGHSNFLIYCKAKFLVAISGAKNKPVNASTYPLQACQQYNILCALITDNGILYAS